MGHNVKKERLPEARALYESGVRVSEIAAALNVSPRTIRRWRSAEADAGRPWRRDCDSPARVPHRPAPSRRHDLVRELEESLADLVGRMGTEDEDARLPDRMLKLCRVIDFLRDDSDDPTCALQTMERFAAFCMDRMTEEEVAPVRRAVSMFVETLRREHT